MISEDLSAAPARFQGWRCRLARAGDALAAGCAVLAAVALGIIVLINGANVLGRHLFDSPIAWAEEGMIFLMVLTVFAGTCTVTWRRQHIRIEVLVEWLNLSGRRAALILSTCVALVVLGATIWGSFAVVSMLHMFDQRSDALEIPMWIPQATVTVGLALNALLFLVRLILDIEEAPAGEPPEAVS